MSKSQVKKSLQRILSGTMLSVAAASAVLAQTPAPLNSGDDKALLTAVLHQNEMRKPSDETVAKIQEIISRNPQDYYARLVMGNSLDKLGLPMQAIEQYKLAIKLGPNNPKPVIELVKAQLAVGQKEAAMRLLQEANKRFPNDNEVLFWMGNYHLAKGDYKTAQEHFRKAGQSNEQFFGMATANAEIYLKQNKPALAVMTVERDMMQNPAYPLGNAVKGSGLFKLRMYARAEPFLKVAFTEFPLKESYAKYYAETCLVLRNPTAALEPAMVALAMDAKAGESLAEMRWVLKNVLAELPYSFVQTQVPIYAERIERFINTPASHSTLADILDEQGYHNLATVQYYKAFKLEPNSAAIAYKIGQNLETYYQKYDQAIMYLTQAHTLDPGNAEIADRLERLMNRLPNRNSDLAWQLKDWLWSQKSPI